jgi:hypothetical protein
MSKLSDELELELERVVKHKLEYNRLSESKMREFVYEEFANWLVTKFEDETHV